MTLDQGGVNLGTAYGRVIIDATGVRQGMQQARQEVQNGFAQMGRTIQGFGSQLTGIGTQWTLATAPMAAFGAVGVKTAMQFDSAMAEISARTGVVGDDLKAVEQLAIDMGAATVFSSQDAANAMLQLLSSGYQLQEAITALPSVLNAAAAGGINLGYAADAVTDILAQFSQGAEDASLVGEALARASASSSATMSDLIQGFANVGPMAANFGMSIEETAAVLAVFSENGIKGAEAGTQLRSMLNNMTRPTAAVQEAWALLGISMYDTQGNVRNLNDIIGDLNQHMDGMADEKRIYFIQTLAGAFGQMGLSALLASDGYDGMLQSMEDATSAEEVAAQRMNTFQGVMSSLGGSFETLMITLFRPLMNEFLKPIALWMINATNAVTRFIANNQGIIQWAAKFLTIFTAIGPVLLMVGNLTKMVGFVMTVLGTAMGGILPIGKALALLFSPMGLMLAGVAGAFLLIKNNVFGLGDTFKKVVAGVRLFFSILRGEEGDLTEGTAAGMGLGTLVDIVRYAEMARTRLSAVFNAMRSTLLQAVAVVRVFIAVLTGSDPSSSLEAAVDAGMGPLTIRKILVFANTVRTRLVGAFNAIRNGARQVVAVVRLVVSALRGDFLGVADDWARALEAGVGNETLLTIIRFATAIRAHLITAFNWLQASAERAWGTVRTIIGYIRDALTIFRTGDFKGGMFGGAYEDSRIVDFVFDIREAFISLGNTVKLLLTPFRTFINLLRGGEGVEGSLRGAFEVAKTIIPQALEAVGGYIKRTVGVWVSLFKDFGKRAGPVLENFFDIIKEVGLPVVEGLADIFGNLLDYMLEALGDLGAALAPRIGDFLFNTLPALLNNFLPKLGMILGQVARYLIRYGVPALLGVLATLAVILIKSLPGIVGGLVNFFRGVLQGIIEAALLIVDVIGPTVREKVGELVDKFKEGFASLKDSISDIFSELKDAVGEKIGEFWSGVKDWLSGAWDTIKGAVSDIGDWLWNDVIKAGVDKVVGYFKGGQAWEDLKAFGDWLKGGLKDAWNALEDAADFIWDECIKPAIDKVKEYFTGGEAWADLQGFGDWLKGGLQAGWDALEGAGDWLWNDVIVAAVLKLANYFTGGEGREYLSGFGTWLKEALTSAWNTMGDTVMWVWTDLVQPMLQGFVDYLNTGPTLGSLSKFGTWLLNALKDAWDIAVSAFGSAARWAWDTFIQPLIDGISELFRGGEGKESLEGAGDNILTHIKNGILDAVADFGAWIKETILDPILAELGLEANVTAVFEAGKSIAQAVIDGLVSIFSGVAGLVDQYILGPINGAIDAVNKAINSLLGRSNDVEVSYSWATHPTAPPTYEQIQAHRGTSGAAPVASGVVGRPHDIGGRGRAGEPAWIGTGAQPELFWPDTAGTFFPNIDRTIKEYLMAAARSGVNAGIAAASGGAGGGGSRDIYLTIEVPLEVARDEPNLYANMNRLGDGVIQKIRALGGQP